ncbi:copper-translocating ATPase 2 [Beggiatoa sp. SS]|nr:copper-translocating ATPase 2 [Beggiatoa sp. SS]
MAERLGMDSCYAEILPENKANIVEELQKQGKVVCFVGDGINDAIAMKKANVSISLRGASSIATDIAQVVLMDGSLSHLAQLFDISNSLETNIRNSLGITIVPTAINIAGIFLFNIRLTSVVTIKNVLFLVGVGNAMLPPKSEIPSKAGLNHPKRH